MPYTVNMMGISDNGQASVLKSLSYPSRAQAAASLRGFGSTKIVRDSDRRIYLVFLAKK